MFKSFISVAVVVGLCTALPARPAVIGENIPPINLPEAIGQLDPVHQRLWLDYLRRSDAARSKDQAVLAAERRGLADWPQAPKSGNGEASMPLGKEAGWYASPEARAIADTIVSFQTPAGGWGKNQPRNAPPRQTGQAFVTGESPPKTPSDSAASERYNGTIDNGATVSEIRFLGRVVAALQKPEGTPYRLSLERGLEYLLAAQYPNGGWPQVWPLQGGYHDAITLNDNAMISVVQLLREVGRGEGDFASLSTDLRHRAVSAEAQAIDNLLAAQVVHQGRPTLWPQQYDPLSFAPASARNYEPPSLCSSESAAVLRYLMTVENPSPRIVAAVHGGVATFRETLIQDKVWKKVSDEAGRRLVTEVGAPPLWARYYHLDNLTPIYGERDRRVYDSIDDISLERRNGYAWFSTAPNAVLALYEDWRQLNPEAPK